MPISKAQQQAVERYNSANYENVRLRVPAGRKHLIESIADANNMSINAAINLILAEACGIDYEVWNDPNYRYDSPTPGDEMNFVVKMHPRCCAFIKKFAADMGISANRLVNEAVAKYLGFNMSVWDGTFVPPAINAAEQDDN